MNAVLCAGMWAVNDYTISRMKSCSSVWAQAVERDMPEQAFLLVVDVTSQRLTVMRKGVPITTYPVSTAARGTGQQEGSRQTPLGFFEVVERYGVGLPAGAEFKGRVFTGRVIPPDQWTGRTGGDMILTRILRLSGLEPGRNKGCDVDTYARYIYLHGTAHEDKIGTPASAGCVRMKNSDMLHLFDTVAEQPVWCWIGRHA